MIEQLRDLGHTITIDDFGTTSLSLNYLKYIHADRLKIDQYFVKNITTSRSNEIVTSAIITMARHLQCNVVATGIETEEQHNFTKNQCNSDIQGYFFSEPLLPTLIEEFFKKLF